VETDGRHAVVAFTADWGEDAARRDFTMNALYADLEGQVFDPTGEGLGDLRNGAVRFVGDPAARITEDALRILRFFRFHALYGRGRADAAALAACAEGRDLIARLSIERIAKELLGLFGAEDPRPAVRLMAGAGVLGLTLPEANDLARFDALVEIETGQLFSCDPVLRLASLLPDDPAVGVAMAGRLRLSNAQRDRVEAALGVDPPLKSWMSPRETRRALWRLGGEAFRDRALLAWAASNRPAAAVQWRALLPIAETWPRPVFPLAGEEVIAAGVPEGPLVGAVLREVEDWWVDQDFPDDKLALIERLKAVAQGMAY